MTTAEPRAATRTQRFSDELVLPFVTIAAIAATAVQWPAARILFPAVALALFVLAAPAAVATLLLWPRMGPRAQLTVITTYTLAAALLLPLAHETTSAVILPYVAAAAAGRRLDSRKAATGVAAAGAVVAASATWVVAQLEPHASPWPWWLALTVGLPVYAGIANRDRLEALRHAQRAAREADHAKESEAREATLRERGRIAREIHDVLGHSLSGIAMQLDMVDALREGGRDEEATAAVRRARALAVDSISETRRAVQALREDAPELPDALRRLAEDNGVQLAITGEPVSIAAEATHTVVRAAQEALTNAAKHAPGARCTMLLAVTAERVRLTVTNTPAVEGAHPPTAGGTGVGLVGMRERATRLGGTLLAEPTRAGGWTVELELPR